MVIFPLANFFQPFSQKKRRSLIFILPITAFSNWQDGKKHHKHLTIFLNFKDFPVEN